MKDAPRVAPDMVVRVSYQLFDEQGVLVDEHPPDEPLEYLEGYAQVIPGLSQGLLGAVEGERRTIELPPELAFGERDEAAQLEIDRSDFPDAERVVAGDELLATGPDGLEVVYRVVEISPDSIVADLNHPLAGQQVRFVAQVLHVRPASDDELDAACADMDERIVYDGTIVYGSQHASVEEVRAQSSAQQPAASAGLIQLRSKEKP